MNIEDIRSYCLRKKAVTEGLPFGEETLVFKTGGKIFLLIGLDNPVSFNVKCDPEKAVNLREKYAEVKPGYHMNKKHWNTVSITDTLTDAQLMEMIDDSYDLVFSSLPKSVREQLK